MSLNWKFTLSPKTISLDSANPLPSYLLLGYICHLSAQKLFKGSQLFAKEACYWHESGFRGSGPQRSATCPIIPSTNCAPRKETISLPGKTSHVHVLVSLVLAAPYVLRGIFPVPSLRYSFIHIMCKLFISLSQYLKLTFTVSCTLADFKCLEHQRALWMDVKPHIICRPQVPFHLCLS